MDPGISAGWFVLHFGPEWSIWTENNYKFPYIPSPQRMKPTDFVEPLTFPLAPPWGWHFFREICQQLFDGLQWMDFHPLGHSLWSTGLVPVTLAIPWLFLLVQVKVSVLPYLLNGLSQDFHGPKTTYFNDFGDPLPFPEEKCPNKYWMDSNEIW